MWVIYDEVNLQILAQHYLKAAAKHELKYFWLKRNNPYGDDIKPVLCKLSKFKTWKALNRKF